MINLVEYSGTEPATDDWCEAVFDGDIVVFSGFPAVDALIDHGRRLCCDAYDSDNPDRLEGLSDKEGFLTAADQLDAAFNKAPETISLFNTFFRATGLSPEDLYYDRWRLRTNPSHKTFLSDKTRHVPPHRDNWGSHIHCQLNWWGPLFEIEPQQALLFYPDYWNAPIANDSEVWSLDALKEHRSRGKDYPTLPTVTAPLPVGSAQPLMLKPGEIACFSGAHLHGSATNRSGRCRFNIETRTVCPGDIARERLAPNVDGPHDKPPANHWFRHCLNGDKLSSRQI